MIQKIEQCECVDIACSATGESACTGDLRQFGSLAQSSGSTSRGRMQSDTPDRSSIETPQWRLDGLDICRSIKEEEKFVRQCSSSFNVPFVSPPKLLKAFEQNADQ